MDQLTRLLGIEYPIVQAPTGGSGSILGPVAAVSNADGPGALGAAYLTPAQSIDAAQRIRALTDKPFDVNLRARGYGHPAPAAPARMLKLRPPSLPGWPAQAADSRAIGHAASGLA